MRTFVAVEVSEKRCESYRYLYLTSFMCEQGWKCLRTEIYVQTIFSSRSQNFNLAVAEIFFLNAKKAKNFISTLL